MKEAKQWQRYREGNAKEDVGKRLFEALSIQLLLFHPFTAAFAALG